MRHLISTLGALGAAALIAGCGGADEPSQAAPPDRPADVVEVSIEDIKFLPQRVTVKVGQTVRWTNADPVAHTVAAAGKTEFSSEVLNRGDTHEFTPTTPGTVDYFCTIHEGQTGTLIVR